MYIKDKYKIRTQLNRQTLEGRQREYIHLHIHQKDCVQESTLYHTIPASLKM